VTLDRHSNYNTIFSATVVPDYVEKTLDHDSNFNTLLTVL